MTLTILVLGVIFLVLVYTEKEDKIELINDNWLRLRMQEVGISTWKDLRKKSGLTSLNLKYVRKAEVKKLNFPQLTQLATVLNWQTEEILQKLGLLKPQNEEIDTLVQECQRLRSELEEQKTELTQEIRESTFNQLQTLLTNYPTLRQMVQVKPDLLAKNIIPLLTPLDNLLNSWGYETIGQAYSEVEYSPQLHQADSSEIQAGEKVYVRFVGYRNGTQIICPAKVSRNLPGGTA